MRRDIVRLAVEANGFLNSGKKNGVINLSSTNANIAIKTARQLFAKVPGIFVYDIDGNGNKLNIATWGLDPHRSWEFNIRQNGVIINLDMYGFPDPFKVNVPATGFLFNLWSLVLPCLQQ